MKKFGSLKILDFLFGIISLLIILSGYFFPYLSELSYFPAGADWIEYLKEYQSYGSTKQLFESVSIWYEPGYFLNLYTLNEIGGDFNLAFLNLDCLMVILYFSSFYFFLGSITQLSQSKKIIASLAFSISFPQLLIFVFSLRKQFFAGIFFLLFFGSFFRIKNKVQILLPSIFFAMTFFTHRGVSLYLLIFSIALLFKSFYSGEGKETKKYISNFFICLAVGLVVNISFLTPFIQIQGKILLDTAWSFWNNLGIALNISELSSNYIARGFDIFRRSDNTLWSYFLGFSPFFILLLSGIKKSGYSLVHIYFWTICAFIYAGSILAGRLAHLANILGFVIIFLFLKKSKFMILIWVLFLIMTFEIDSFSFNIKNHYFSVMDEYLINFQKIVPKENTFLVDYGNRFTTYAGYKNKSVFYKKDLLNTKFEEFNENRVKSSYYIDALSYLFLYKKVILPESLRGDDIYVIFGYFLENYPFPETKNIGLYNKSSYLDFASSVFFEEINISGFRDPRNNYQGSLYPINHVFKLKHDAPRKYVPDENFIDEAKKAINEK